MAENVQTKVKYNDHVKQEELENPRLLVFNIDNNMERDALEEDIN